MTVDPDGSAGDVVEPGQETCGRGLSRSCPADESDGLARSQMELEPVEDRRPVGIVERDVVEVDIAATVDQVDGPGSVDDGRRLIEQLVDALCGGGRALTEHEHHP